MTDPQHNDSGQRIDTHCLSVQQYKAQLPLLLDRKGRKRHDLNRLVRRLADFADYETGRNAHPSVDTLAADLHFDRRKVFRLLRQAEDEKLIAREGRGPKGVTSWRLNLDLDLAAAWLPYDAAEEHRKAAIRERVNRHRAKLAGGAPQPVTSTSGGASQPVTEEGGNAVSRTQSVIPDQQKEDPQISTAVAVAPSAAVDVIDAELVDEKPAGELVLKPSTVPAVADLSAAWLLPEVEETGKRKRSAPVDAPRYDAEAWQLPREQHTPSEWTKTLVGLYIEAARSHGFEPSGRQIGQVGKEVRGLVAAGNNPVHILAAVRRAAERRGAWVLRAMADVQPGNWSAVRPGKQLVTSSGVVQLPEGMTNAQRRQVSIAAALAEYKAKTA